jgi:hypothetical protein
MPETVAAPTNADPRGIPVTGRSEVPVAASGLGPTPRTAWEEDLLDKGDFELA